MPADPDTTTDRRNTTASTSSPAAPGGWARIRRESVLYVTSGLITTVAVVWMSELWRADWSSPFYYVTDAIGSMMHFKTTIETGWYENQPRMGVPYGQHYHDFPFSDDLHPFMAKVFGWITGGNWVAAFNGYYLATFLFCAVAAVWFFRVAGLSGPLSVVLSVLYSVAPYHFIRGEVHLFLAGYYLVPPAMVIALRLARGEPVWGLRPGVRRVWSILTGRGAGTFAIIALVVYDGIYYAVFFGLIAGVAALLRWWRSRDRRRFRGALAVGGILLAWCVVAMLPDFVYTALHGKPSGSLIRKASDAEWYGLKFLQLVLPSPGHPIPILAHFRDWYDSTFPAPSEHPSLGLVAAIGFVGLLGYGVRAMAGPRAGVAAEEPIGRAGTLRQLSLMTWVAFMLSTMGGLGAGISLIVSPIRGWNRMSIVIALLALAGFGLGVQALVRWGVRRFTGDAVRARSRVSVGVRRATPVVAALVLVIGVAEQSVTGAVPPYQDAAASFQSDQRFFAGLEGRLPAGSMVFQLPYMPYPESDPKGGASESDQLRPFLHTTTLRWSGGGIKGRPQTEWPAEVTARSPEQMVQDLATIGFVGIVVDRVATDDDGRLIEQSLEPYTGQPLAVSDDGRWSYLSLAAADQQVLTTMSPAQRATRAAELVHADG